MSTESKHTPGPWKAFVQEHPFSALRHIDCDAGMIRCPLEMPLATVKANAYLIESAPELLEDVEALRESVSELLIRWRNADEAYHDAIGRKAEVAACDTQTHKTAEARLKHSAATLAKAKGGAS
jgi:hypothetical protein